MFLTSRRRIRNGKIPFSDAAVERGKKLFLNQCSMCHGVKADGKGDLARAIKITPPDFTKPEVLSKRTDGKLFTIMGQGSDTMPGESGRLSDTERWEIVSFLRAVEGKVPERATEQEKEQLEHTVVIQH